MSGVSIFTQAVHAGEDRTEHYGALSVPIYPASVYGFPDADEAAAVHNEEKEGFYYGRLGNPTQQALEGAIARLENAEAALAFASGMAAISAAVLAVTRTGDHIVAPKSMYSTTTSLLHSIRERFGIETTFIDASAAQNYEAAIRPNTRLLWVETPSNPMLQITDISEVASIGRRHNVVTVADNTFATPFNQRPLELGLDLVAHSATKYLGGHSDLTAGILAGRKDLVEAARLGPAKLYGGNIAPQAAWLVLRGVKTLALRIERHNENALAVAQALAGHPRVVKAYYPGLPDHPGHDIARRQMERGSGGMVAFELETADAARRFVNGVRLCTIGTSLGGVETIVQHSVSMTHATLSPEERQAAGIADGLIRLSVGIEDADDLIADLTQALDGV